MKICYCIFSFSVCCLLFAVGAHGQAGDCEPSTGEAILDAGNVRASIFNNGALFYRGSQSVYEVPKDEDANSISAASIWVAGLIDNELRVAAATYSAWEFWAGPLDENGNPPVDCTVYDEIWEITGADLQNYAQSGTISDNLQNWPWQIGAPVIDGDGNPDNYDLEAGDLPALLGDQRLWWIMNDNGNAQQYTPTEPIGLEIQASAHAFFHQDFLGNVTFYEYNLINKNSLPLTEAFFSYWMDFELGQFDDDYFGSDSLLHLGFGYNADNEDDVYGIAPPAIGSTFFETIVADDDGLDNDRDGDFDEPAEMMGVSSVMSYYGGGGILGDPGINASDFYNLMQARWRNGDPLVEGGDGYNWQGPPGTTPHTTKFFYPGDPVTGSFWSQFNFDGLGTPGEPLDRWFLVSTGPFNIAPRDTVTIRFAIVWSRGESNIDSVAKLKEEVGLIRREASVFFEPTTMLPTLLDESPSPAYVPGFDQNFPNPFSQSTTIRYSLPKEMQVRLAVYDVLGREVALLVEARQEAGIYTVDFDAGDLPAGVYVARIELDYLRFVRRMVLVH